MIPSHALKLDSASLTDPRDHGGQAAHNELIIAEIFRTLRKHRFLITGCPLVCLAVAALYICLRGPLYEATSQIEIGPTGSNSLGLNELASKAPTSDPTIQLQSAVQILRSRTVASEAMEQLRMPARRDFAGPWVQPAGCTMEDISAQARERLLTRFESGLAVDIVPKTDIIVVRFRAANPQLAADAVNAVVNSYTERNFRTSYNSAMQVSEWLSRQMNDLRDRAEDSQRKLADFQQATGLIGSDESDNIVTDKLKQLDEQLTEAQSDRIVKEARYRIAQSGNPELIASAVPNPTLQVLRTQQAELRVQYAQLSTKFGTGYPKLAELGNQMLQVDDAIAVELKNLSQRYRNDYEAASNSENMLRVKFDEQKQKAYELNAKAFRYGILKHEVESTQDLYETLQLKLNQAGIIAGLASANVGIVDRGQIPWQPVEPKPAFDLFVALGGGLATGIMCAIGLEAIDNTVHSTEELEQVSTFPVLTAIPRIGEDLLPWPFSRLRGSDRPQPSRLICDMPPSHAAECFRSLRTALLQTATYSHPTTLVVTSSASSEGKSFVAANYAIVLAQLGSKVLLVDADLRHSSLQALFRSPQSSRGLNKALATGEIRDQGAVSPSSVPGLTVLPAGTEKYSADLLGSDKMRSLMASWRTEYDYIVIDTPPVCLFTDAVVLAAGADAVLLVVRASQTTKHAVRHTRDVLLRADARIAGVVLNGVDPLYQSAYYFQRYGYMRSSIDNLYGGRTD